MEPGTVALVVRRTENLTESLRSAIGLAMEDHRVSVFLIEAALDPLTGDPALGEFLEMLDDLEGNLFASPPPEGDRRVPFVQYLDTVEIARRLPEFDLVIPF